ncbi:MAG TPA: DUF3307 domain-containing protein, partial [bacterium]|nr:DUF3307 domain-containing protein [bacterium]
PFNIGLVSSLVLAHLLADFPLQADVVFRWKKKGSFGVAIHAAIFVLVAYLLLLPMVRTVSVVVMIGSLGFVHFWIDETKLRLFRRIEVDNLWAFLADQALHFMSLLLAAWLFAKHAANVRLEPEMFRFTLQPMTCGVVTGLIVSSYFGVLITHYMEKMLFGSAYHNENLRPADKYLGILGRLCVTSAFLPESWFVLSLTVALGFLFFLSWRVKGWTSRLFVYYLSSAVLASLVGMFLM